MKIISLGIIFSIIFSIVLSKNSSGSGSTMSFFSFLKKKTKKKHKIDKPVKVKCKEEFDPGLSDLKFIDEFDPMIMETYKGHQTELDESFISEANGAIVDKVAGFLRRKNESRRKGWYIRPYEEEYEDMIKSNFISLKNNYQYNQMNANKQSGVPPAVPKALEKQELAKEQKLTTINEGASFLGNGENEEIYEKNKHLLCINPEETAQAIKVMNEAVIKLEYYATRENDYESNEINSNASTDSCKEKREDNKGIIKSNFQIDDPNKYNKIINKLWDPDYPNSSDHPSSSDPYETKTKIVRVYSPNLVMIQRRFNNPFYGCQKYLYALATKVEISEDKTIIVMTSANINDHNSKNTISYKNPIIESANLFEAEINSEEDIKSGKLIKSFINIAGHLIEKKDNCVNITYVLSINGLIHLSINEPSKDH
ncbi:Acidic phosphoprotein precursor PCEMA1, putative [Plasmodium chabaudi adami]|uniref:Acidic phosphoprotein PCEMA1, putative n=1 Tax=Plasmodium chabaudi adami TaxID=5826 RepID=A0A1C6WNX6_PLACE|nr:Acidic phosphoprotein precursor PCEMA1, putative [Plasmodium chabaudi adami]